MEQLRAAVMQASRPANVVLLRTPDGTVHFPPVCPNCEQPAASTLRIERAFLFHVQSADDTPNDTVQSIDAFDVPFCDACVNQHRSQQRPPSSWTPLRRIFSEAEGFAGLVVMAIAFMFVASGLKSLSLVAFLLAILPFSIGFWLLRSTWTKSRYLGLAEATRVDLAVDFTPFISLEFEPAWRAFQFRSQLYAILFRQANVQQLWSPRSAEARLVDDKRQGHAFRSNLVIGAVVLAIFCWSLWQEIFSK